MKTVRKQLAAVAAAMSVCLATSVAVAEVRPADAYVEMGNWRYTPILDSNREGSPVTGFMGLLNPSVSVGNNITAIWYTRDNAGVWTSKAWVSEDEWKVIEAVKAATGISSSYDSDWATWGPKSQAVAPSAQTAALYDKGFLVGDPVGDMARQSEQYNEIVEFLKDVGYPAADVKFEKDNPDQCQPVYFLNWMSSVATAAVAASRTESSVATAVSSLACGSDWLWPHWTWTTVPAPAWGPTAPPSTTPGDWTWKDYGLYPLSTLGYCGYEYTVTQTRSRTRVRYYLGEGTATCVETQTQTCTYRMECLHDAGGSNASCPATPSCSATPTGPTCTEGAWSSCW